MEIRLEVEWEKEEVSKVPRDRKVATTPAKESGDNALVR